MGGGLSQRGVTIVEALVALAIAAMAAAGAVELLTGQIRHLSRQEALAEQRQEGRAAVAVLARELRLAGGPAPDDPACHSIAGGIEVEGSTVRFLAELYGVATVIDAPASAGDTTLRIPDDDSARVRQAAVSPGPAFAAHDIVYLYDPGRTGDGTDDRVECHRLDRDGRTGVITLATGDVIRRSFPAGSRLAVVNEVRYAYDGERHRLMRTVDGGAQALADRIASAEFSLRQGRVAARIIFEPRPSAAGIGDQRDVWEMLVALRNGPVAVE
ncbi:MAG TPA: prepilin-type N-terminal cleavage/methylation domain-containing protein [Nitrospiria bacterium]|nr:prepilin-type N-terminal cleavage/methylation domain-containing protein [Nitrospiria bacterium]